MQDRELLLLVVDAVQPHGLVEWVWLTKNLIGNGAHSPRVSLAVVNHNSTSRDCRGHLNQKHKER